MKTKPLSLWSFLVLCLCIFPAGLLLFSQSPHPLLKPSISGGFAGDSSKTLSPCFFVRTDDPALDQLPLKSSSAEVNIAGVIADVCVKQQYANEGRKVLEAVYIFPASTRAAVYSLRMSIGKRTIIARISEREKARREYETAKNQGKSASLLEEDRPNVFRMNVANILPGDLISVELRYTELLVPEEGVYSFVYPTVVGPRYSNRPETGTPPQEHWVANPYTHETVKPAYTFDLRCTITAGMPVSGVNCPGHKTRISFLSPGTALIVLDSTEKQGGNRDFILRYRLDGKRVQTGLMLYPGEDENFFLALIQPPRQFEQEQIPPREYVFIMDVSGSMQGFPISISKKLLSDLIGNLQPADRFNVLLFSGGNSLFSEQSVAADAENLQKALNFIDREQGSGGTELLPALKRALALKGSEGYARSFVIATDGYVDVEKEAFELIRSHLDKASFFPFGIGSSVNRYIIEGMAHAGGGLPFIVTDPSAAPAEARHFRQYVSNPVLSHIKLSFNGFEAYDLEPLSVPDVFSDRPVLVFGKYRGAAAGTIGIRGLSGEGEFVASLEVSKTIPSKSNSALRYLWARERIRNLGDFGSPDENTPKLLTALGLKYNLLTAYTSFLAVDSETRNTEGASVPVAQPLPLPEGVSDQAVGGVMVTGYGIPKAGKSGAASINAQDEDVDHLTRVAGQNSKAGKQERNAVFCFVEEMPVFPGGDDSLKAFLARNLNYPLMARQNGIQGTVYVSFIVKKNGLVTDIRILRGIGGGCDEETLRAIALMPRWKPGKQNGKNADVQFNLPVKFTLPKE